MPRPPKAKTAAKDSTANLGFEEDFDGVFVDGVGSDIRADYVRANPPFNDSDTALRGSAFPQSVANPQVVSEAKDNFRKVDDVRWQFGGARKTPAGSPHLFRALLHELMTAETRVNRLQIPTH
jgi:hypothetical protein